MKTSFFLARIVIIFCLLLTKSKKNIGLIFKNHFSTVSTYHALSILNAVISTNERHWIIEQVMWLFSSVIIKCSDWKPPLVPLQHIPSVRSSWIQGRAHFHEVLFSNWACPSLWSRWTLQGSLQWYSLTAFTGMLNF